MMILSLRRRATRHSDMPWLYRHSPHARSRLARPRRKRSADWTHGPRDQIPFLLQVPKLG